MIQAMTWAGEIPLSLRADRTSISVQTAVQTFELGRMLMFLGVDDDAALATAVRDSTTAHFQVIHMARPLLS